MLQDQKKHVKPEEEESHRKAHTHTHTHTSRTNNLCRAEGKQSNYLLLYFC